MCESVPEEPSTSLENEDSTDVPLWLPILTLNMYTTYAILEHGKSVSTNVQAS